MSNSPGFSTVYDAGMNERLGHAIERLRTLGATGIVLDAAIIDADGRVAATWFPTQRLPVRADVLSRLAWQCETRAGVVAYVRLPAGAALRTLADPAKVRGWFACKQPPAARALAAATRVFQIHGDTAIGWNSDDPVHDRPKAKIAGPTVSASTFPVKF